MSTDTNKEWSNPELQWVMLPKRERTEAILAVHKQCKDLFEHVPETTMHEAISNRLNHTRRYWQQRERGKRRVNHITGMGQPLHDDQSSTVSGVAEQAIRREDASKAGPEEEDDGPDELAAIIQGKMHSDRALADRDPEQ